MKRSKWDKEEYKMYSLRRKSTREYNFGAKPYSQEEFKEKADVRGNKDSGSLRVRPHPAKLLTCEKGFKKSLRLKGKHQQHNADANASQGGPRFQP